jgi:hypothetical protein
MMMILAALAGLVVASVQVSFAASFGSFWSGLWIVALITIGELLDFDSQLVMAILLGLVLDYYSGGDFGMHMVFAVIVVLVARLAHDSFDSVNRRLVDVSLSLVFVAIYGLLRMLPSLNVVALQNWLEMIRILGLQLLGGLASYALLLGITSGISTLADKVKSGVLWKPSRRIVK